MNDIINKAKSIKGQFVSVTYERPCKVKKGAPEIMKHTKASAMRVGCEYDGLKTTLESKGVTTKEEAHKLNTGLKGMSWVDYPVVLKSDYTGKEYIRFSTAKNTKFETEYTMNGKKVSKNEIADYLLASEKNHNGDLPSVLNIGVDTIKEITIR